MLLYIPDPTHVKDAKFYVTIEVWVLVFQHQLLSTVQKWTFGCCGISTPHKAESRYSSSTPLYHAAVGAVHRRAFLMSHCSHLPYHTYGTIRDDTGGSHRNISVAQ